MVAYHDLYDCRVDQWQKAADDWVDPARRSSSACEDIRAQGKKPLDATGRTPQASGPAGAWKTSPTVWSPAATS
ncbi:MULTISPECIES: hypothetical protein [unclassified Streptomyces]|uniref:hypothetical protein n=1 Tax=unclassified Streptomyces TaxID=2593676 RepID=UPI0004BE027C|nr:MULTISPECIES: hypothetical protein [unclassified Streptomyces]